MSGISIPSLVLILVIILLLFGTKKLKNIGSDLGSAVKGFQKSIKHDEEDKDFPAKPLDQKTDDKDQEKP